LFCLFQPVNPGKATRNTRNTPLEGGKICLGVKMTRNTRKTHGARNTHNAHLSNPGGLVQKVVWIVSWLALVLLGLDFFNWGKTPRLLLGLPGWLWWEVGLVLLVAAVFGLLSRFAWGDE
jgi:hypothetical protein